MDLATSFVHVRGMLGAFGDGFYLVDGRLAGLELLAFGDDGSRFRQAVAQLSSPRVEVGNRGTAPSEEPGGDGTDTGDGSAQER